MRAAQNNISDAALAEMMHECGIRPSVQRIAVLSMIANRRTHPTADEIYSTLVQVYPSLSRTTVYNSLHTLVEAELIRELDIESGSCRYDFARQPRHGHFACRKCGRIFDISMPERMETAECDGFAIESIDLYFKGLCKECYSEA